MFTRHERSAAPALWALAFVITSMILGVCRPAWAEGTIARWKAEAARLADEGKRKAARAGYAKVLESDPDDGEAWREIGRLSLAMGELEVGNDALGRAAELLGKEGGIELYYLLGESYYSLGKERKAAAAHEMALELMNTASAKDRLTTLWRARIYARQGKMDAATGLYRRLEAGESSSPSSPASPDSGTNADSGSGSGASSSVSVDEEAWLNHAEAYLLNKKFGEASHLLRKFLTLVPGQPRAVEMLAYALEGQGDLEQELAVRRALITNAPESAAYMADYGRALERAQRIDAAVVAYKSSLALHDKRKMGPPGATPSAKMETPATDKPDDANDHAFNAKEVALRVGMLEGRSSVEIGGHGNLLNDPLANTTVLQAGLAVPFAQGRHHLAFYGLRADASGRSSQEGRSGDVTLGGAALVVGSFSSERRLRLVCEVLQGTTSLSAGRSQWTRIGGSAELFYPISQYVLLSVRGAFQEAWRESAATFLEAGTQSLGLARVYVRLLDQRIIFDVGGMGRQLELLGQAAPNSAIGMQTPSAKQLLLWAGFDVVLWADHSRRLAGDMLDERFLGSSQLASGVVITARHYHAETSTDALFAERLALVSRATIEEVGLVLRHVMFQGCLGAELRGAGGYDTSRKLWLKRAGASITMMPTARQRAVLSYDYAAETATGVSGERHAGMLSYRIDL